MVFDKRGRVLSTGRNSYVKTHTLQAKAAKAVGQDSRQYLHAEIAALLKVTDWKKAHKISIFRFTKDGKPALAKPCACCMWVIKQTGIKHLEYTQNVST